MKLEIEGERKLEGLEKKRCLILANRQVTMRYCDLEETSADMTKKIE